MVIPLSSDLPARAAAAPGINTSAGTTADSRIADIGALQKEKKALTGMLVQVFNDRLKGRVTQSGLRADPAIAKRADEIWKATVKPEKLSIDQLQSLIADANAIGYLADQVIGTKTGETPANPKPEFAMSPERLARVQERYTAQLNLDYRNAVKQRVLGRVGILHLDDNPERAAIINEILDPYRQKRLLTREEAQKAIADVEKIGRLADFLNRRGVKAEYIAPQEALKPAEGEDTAETERRRRDYYLSSASLTDEDIHKAQSWEHLPRGTQEISVEDAIRLGPPPVAKSFVDYMKNHARRKSEGRCLLYVENGLGAAGLPRPDEALGGAVNSPGFLARHFIRVRGVTKENASLLPDSTILAMVSGNPNGHIDVVGHKNGRAVGISDHISRAPAAYAIGTIWAFVPYVA